MARGKLCLRVEWDEQNIANRKKHGLSFEDAAELFTSGRDYLEFFDAAHSEMEDRFIAIGHIQRGVALVVWVEKEEDVVRMISARFASKREQAMYQAHMGDSG